MRINGKLDDQALLVADPTNANGSHPHKKVFLSNEMGEGGTHSKSVDVVLFLPFTPVKLSHEDSRGNFTVVKG